MNCFKFLKKSLEERREFDKINKLCENCLWKGHLLESCISKFNCRKDGCSQKHHILVQKDQTIENVVSNKIQTSHNETISPNTYLQITPVIVSNEPKPIRTNALLNRLRLDVCDIRHITETQLTRENTTDISL